MNEQTRYRVTGAVFLLSIGIIVLPMIFDGEGVRVKQLPELTEPLPPLPTTSELDALEISTAEVAQHQIEQAKVGGLLDDEGFMAEDGTRIGDPLLREVDDSAQEDSVVAGAVQREPAPAVVEPPATEAVASQDPTSAVERAASRAPSRRVPPAEGVTRSLAKQAIWAVQLASFASPVNATALRDKLLGEGFEAWTSTARGEAGIRTRVAIGPLLDRGDAERMRDLVSDRYRVSAIVVHMEP